MGQPSETFPYPFVGYRRLAGAGADQIPAAARTRLATDIGQLFSELHRIDPGRVPPTPDGWEREPTQALLADLAGAAELARSLLTPALRAQAEPYLAGRVPEPPAGGPRRFIHNDICADHLLANPGTGRLSGLIDFTDALVGDPVHDFVGLITIGGYGFISQVAVCYDLPPGDGFQARLRWLCRVMTLTWLAEAAEHDPARVPTHLSWVDRAFAG